MGSAEHLLTGVVLIVKYPETTVHLVIAFNYEIFFMGFINWDYFLVWGVCSHCFHMHCIMKWLASQQQNQVTQQCPMCRQDWALKSE